MGVGAANLRCGSRLLLFVGFCASSIRRPRIETNCTGGNDALHSCIAGGCVLARAAAIPFGDFRPRAGNSAKHSEKGIADRREPGRDHQERRLVQHLGDQCRRPVDRPAPARAWTRFWYIDPDSGLDGVWDNSLAAEKPIYNADFTEMTVKLRSGIFWSDGVEFTADDVVYTVETQMKTNGLRWSAPCCRSTSPIGRRRPIRYTVVFKLKKPNSRFHALFTVRWNAIWIMPKHVFEKVDDPLKFDFNKPVSLGAYMLHSYDPNGKWFIWQLRDDWQRTTLGALRQAGAEIRRLYRSRPAGQARDRAAQPRARHHPRHRARGHVHAGQAVRRPRTAGSRASPTRHPDPTLPAVIFNTQNEHVQEPRRALGAGAADRHQGGVDGVLSRRRDHLGDRRAADRHASGRLSHADGGLAARTSSSTPASARSSRTIPTVGKQIADMLRPSHGRPDPDRPEGDRQVVRHGLVEARSAGRAPSCWRRPASRKRGDDWYHAGRQAVHRSASWSRARRAR